MLRIGLIEDEPVHGENTVSALKLWSEENGTPITVKEYRTDKAFFFDLDDGMPFDVLIVDIILEGSTMSGTDIAYTVRRRDERIKILFLTRVTDAFQDGFELGALQYLMKPLKYPQLRRTMDRALLELTKQDATYFILRHGKDSVFRIAHNDILYMESSAQRVVIQTTAGRTYTDWRPLKDIEHALPEDFARIHRSYIVNLQHVDRLDARACFVRDKRLPISRTYLADVRRAWSSAHRRV